MLIKQVDFCLNIRISFSSKGFVLGLLMFFFLIPFATGWTNILVVPMVRTSRIVFH